MKYLFKIITVFILFSMNSTYAEDPFSRSFSAPANSSGEVAIIENGSDGVHPMMQYDIKKYFVKGVISSTQGSIAIMSVAGGKDYILFVGDPIGNDMHIIKTISRDFIIAGKNSTDEETTIPVSNPIIPSGM